MAKLFIIIAAVLLLSETIGSSVIPPPEVKARVLEKPLSEEIHFSDDEHNSDYDHEAFLGKDEVREFDHMTPEDSKKHLGIIYDKIDKDSDGKVTEKELEDWIKYVQTRYVRIDTDRQWAEHNIDDTPTLSWDSYKHRIYALAPEDDDDDEKPETETRDEGGRYDYRIMLRRDRRRWSRADVNADGELSKDEFASFLHPEETEHMKDLIVDETLDDIDRDKDGKLSLEEYIGDMWSEQDSEEPEWVQSERDQFSKYRDLNHDGFMDRGEVQQWIAPPDYDHTNAEAKHLIRESDTDVDGMLTKEEMLDKYEVFVSSQATDFGDALRKHDEF